MWSQLFVCPVFALYAVPERVVGSPVDLFTWVDMLLPLALEAWRLICSEPVPLYALPLAVFEEEALTPVLLSW